MHRNTRRLDNSTQLSTFQASDYVDQRVGTTSEGVRQSDAETLPVHGGEGPTMAAAHPVINLSDGGQIELHALLGDTKRAKIYSAKRVDQHKLIALKVAILTPVNLCLLTRRWNVDPMQRQGEHSHPE